MQGKEKCGGRSMGREAVHDLLLRADVQKVRVFILLVQSGREEWLAIIVAAQLCALRLSQAKCQHADCACARPHDGAGGVGV
jgi:hypothetical protein